ncbi:MAG: aminodeoxychorismate lyase, partial [Bacteroidota bacterium]
MRKTLLFSVLVLALIGGGVAAWLAFLPNTANTEAVGVKLPTGTTFETAIDSLQSVGALGSETSFSTFGSLTGW